MNRLLTIIALAAAGWVVLMLLLKGAAAVLRRSALKAAMRALDGEEVILMSDNSSFMGADFPGPNLPPRTNGVLAVTPARLFFLPWFPRKSIVLPAQWILGAEAATTFKDLSYRLPFLSVRVRDLGDPEGRIAWAVHDLEKWVEAVGSMSGGD